MNPITLTHPELNANVRIIERNDQPWFVAKDVCDVLGLANSRDALASLDDDEKVTLTNSNVGEGDISLPNRGLQFVSESGLYVLIFKSQKPAAKSFRKWVTSEVLPSLRKDGFYASRLSPGDRELLVLEYKIQAAKLRDESRYWDHKAAVANHLPDALPLFEWVAAQFPDLSPKQQANMTRQVKRDLIAGGMPVGIANGARRTLTARRSDLATLSPRTLRV